MLFNSYLFLIFFLLIVGIYINVKHRSQNIVLLLASYVFYGTWDWRFLFLILASTFVDYYLSLKIYQSKSQKNSKRLLFLSIFFNLGLLGFFKYFGFFIDSANQLFNLLGVENTANLRLNIILPVGISFYTFQTMSYTIDVARKKITPIRNYLDYSLYVAFFPQLVAGPIERAKNLIPQIVNKRHYKISNIRSGLWLVSWGLFKKVVVADNLAIVVDKIFRTGVEPDGISCLIGIYAFAFQIYGDFSGYSDIARGISKLLGFNLMVNFKIPYLSRNPQEFWNRWHISLSSWLKDYLYIPLGGSRLGNILTYRNLIITMVLGGIWHGAAWSFIIWGLYHGLLLMIHRFMFGSYSKKEYPRFNIIEGIKIITTFNFICFGWLIFRANSVEQAMFFLKQIFTSSSLAQIQIHSLFSLIFFAGMLWILEFLVQNRDDLKSLNYYRPELAISFITCIWIGIYILAPSQGQNFIYFQF